jgi:hypothetical protein
MRTWRSILLGLFLLSVFQLGQAQIKWYRFDKAFVEQHFAPDSAVGILRVKGYSPASGVHTVDCGGDDGELHLGILQRAVIRDASDTTPISTPGQAGEIFGIVAEPPNAKTSVNMFTSLRNQEVTFLGYYRLWNEGHDVTRIFPSNPHHVLELHPTWAVKVGQRVIGSPAVIFPMLGYSGYGVSKYGPLLGSLQTDQWLQVGEDDRFVYVQLKKADNFYQLPVVVKAIRPVTKAKEVLVDVYSDPAPRRLVYPNLTVVVAEGSAIAQQLRVGQRTSLLGFFSANLRKAIAAAAGHQRETPVPAAGILEFFAFGVPTERAVASCN